MCLKVVNPVDAESNHLQPKTAFSPQGDSLPNRQGWSSEIYNRPFHISFQLLIKTSKFTKFRDDMSIASEDFAPQTLVILQTLISWGQKLSLYHDTNVCIACWLSSRERTHEQVAKLRGAEEMKICGKNYKFLELFNWWPMQVIFRPIFLPCDF